MAKSPPITTFRGYGHRRDPGYFDTRAAALWDDQNLYVAFWLEEPFVEAQLTERIR